MSIKLIFAAAITCLGASAAQAACPSKSSSAVRGGDIVTLELQGSKPSAMGSRQALEAAGYSIRQRGAVVFDRAANTRMFCDGTDWVVFDAAGAGGSSSGGTAPCPSKAVTWGGGCGATAPSGVHDQTISVSKPKNMNRDCTYKYSGSATFICRDGIWLNQGGSCSKYWAGCK